MRSVLALWRAVPLAVPLDLSSRVNEREHPACSSRSSGSLRKRTTSRCFSALFPSWPSLTAPAGPGLMASALNRAQSLDPVQLLVRRLGRRGAASIPTALPEFVLLFPVPPSSTKRTECGAPS